MAPRRRVISQCRVKGLVRLPNHKKMAKTGKNDGTGGEEMALSLLNYTCPDCGCTMINANNVKKNTEGHDLECVDNVDDGDCHCAIQVKSYQDKNSDRIIDTGLLHGCGSYSGQREASALYNLYYIIVFYDANYYVTRTIFSGPVRVQDIIKKDNTTRCDVKLYNMQVIDYV
jgi:hypothetical protein